jgi:hypothetical protein
MTLRREASGIPHGASPRAVLGRAAAWVLAAAATASLLADVAHLVLTPVPVAALLPPPPPVIAKTPVL